MVKEGYKEVKTLGKGYIIPEEWSLVELNEVLTVIRNGSSKKQNQQKQGLPVSRIETISDGSINHKKIGYLDVKPEELKKHKLQKGDILFSHINSVAHIGKVAQYEADKPLYHGMNLLKLRFDNQKVEDKFMLYRLKSTNAKQFYERYAKQAVNQASLNQNDVGLYSFPLPPKKEQKKIADILSTVDENIAKTEEVIEKTKELKKGLMQQLLTKGIGHDEFKEVRLGVKSYNVPKKWEVRILDELVELRNGKFNPTKNLSDEHSIPVYGGNGITGFYNSFLIEKPTIIIGRVGEYCGSIHLAKEGCWVTDNAIYINNILEPSIINIDFLALYLEFINLNRLSNRTGQPKLTQSRVSSIDIIIPPLDEQKKIADILLTVDKKIQKEEEHKDNLELLKKGLMQKLLTGEVRVKVAN